MSTKMTPNEQERLFEQDYFQTIYKGLKSQGFKRCVDNIGQCIYHGPDNMHCAVGWLLEGIAIPKSYETSSAVSMYNNPARELREISAVLNNVSAHFLQYLQYIHDKATDPNDMQERLETYANQQGFSIPD